MEQYKHPCLIPDPAFRESIPVEQELCTGDGSGLRVDPAASVGRTRYSPLPRPAGEAAPPGVLPGLSLEPRSMGPPL